MFINYNNAFINQLNYLTQHNSCLTNNQTFSITQNNLAEVNPNSNIFLQKKRNQNELNDFFSENSQPTFSEKKWIQIKNKNIELKENELDNEIDNMKIINDSSSNSNNNIINNSNIIEKENIFNNYINENMNLNYLITNKIINYNNDETNDRTSFNEIIFNNLLKKVNSKNNSPDNDNIRNKNFNITNVFETEKSNKNDNNINKMESFLLANTEKNNEIKVLKNNKVVFMNSYLLNSPSTSKRVKKLKKITFIGGSKRSSKFRGVSKNGNQWQVLLMYKKSKSYVGSYNSEEMAAKIYDFLSIKLRGVKARTNFKYTFEQIKKIGDSEFDQNSKNLEDIITQMEL